MKNNNRRTSLPIAPVFLGLFLLTSAVLDAQAQLTYAEIRCRGGQDLFRIDNLGTTDGTTDLLIGLNFSPSRWPAGVDNRGLEPGTCMWVGRGFQETDPQQIQFRSGLTEANMLAAYLQDSNNYWTFVVANTDRGYYDTKSHGPWNPKIASGSAAPTVIPRP